MDETRLIQPALRLSGFEVLSSFFQPLPLRGRVYPSPYPLPWVRAGGPHDVPGGVIRRLNRSKTHRLLPKWPDRVRDHYGGPRTFRRLGARQGDRTATRQASSYGRLENDDLDSRYQPTLASDPIGRPPSAQAFELSPRSLQPQATVNELPPLW